MSNSWNDQVLTVKGNYTMVPTGPRTILVGGARTITLPSCASSLGREVVIVNADNDNVTIDRAGSDTINTPRAHSAINQVLLWNNGETFRATALEDENGTPRWFTTPELVHIPESARGSTVIVSSGSSTTGASIGFASYCPPGATSVMAYARIRLNGNGAGDFVRLHDTVSSVGEAIGENAILEARRTNLDSGLDLDVGAVCWFELEDDRDGQYTLDTNGSATVDTWIYEPRAYMRA